ncbi:hypothetical protein SOVF_116850, partial [Spinacia oleracea]
MGLNVFGTPITVDTVKEMPEYHESKMIYSADCATVALEMKNAEGKDISARSFLEYMEPRFGLGVSTMCMIYNATGHPLTLVDTHSWEGRICETPYPMVILNGQWGAFLHGQYHNGAASEACVVYNGLNFDWVLSFTNSNSNTNTKTNRVYTNIRTPQHNGVDWDAIKSNLDNGKTTHTGVTAGVRMFASIGDISKCTVEAILTISDALDN